MPIVATKKKPAGIPILIRSYGEFWNPEFIDWDKKKIFGTRGYHSKGPLIDIYGEKGIYVLYKDFAPVYVGRADSSIGERLRAHRESRRKGPRWDTFSWFVVSKNHGGASETEVIATLEALLILAIDPRLNSRREKFTNAVRLSQYIDESKPDEFQQLRQWIGEKLEEIRKELRESAAAKASSRGKPQ
jgi:hypothetical protein